MAEKKISKSKKSHLEAQKSLHNWFQEYHRPLPWRQDKDPYKIWISETMLQQTTTTAVIPFFERFLKKFPTLQDLAKASIEDIYEVWAGLGYYSRARNLHKAAQMFAAAGGLPDNCAELINFPGIGPYTSRSIASIAFGESVGVLDGNVIRILSRFYNLPLEWWKTKDRKALQDLADNMVKDFPPSDINQAMMELGATICTPTSPKCLSCPWIKICQSFKKGNQMTLPLKKPKKSSEIWVWEPMVYLNGSKIGLCKNDYAPFLKGQWFLPGKAKKVEAKPQKFHFNHSITHHKIYVKVKLSKSANKDLKWVNKGELKQWTPASLLEKVVAETKKIDSEMRSR